MSGRVPVLGQDHLIEPVCRLDPELGAGGACQDIASAMAGALAEIGVEEVVEVYTELDGVHVFLVANLADGVFRVDVPPGAYETGAGYAWRKRDEVQLHPENFILERVEGPIPDAPFRYRYAEEGRRCLTRSERP